MNNFKLKLQKIINNDSLTIDGITFSQAMLVKLFIDNKPIESFNCLDSVLIVFSELKKSLTANGLYLIFTSASGIADDGGWEGVRVSIKNDLVNWDFEAEEKYNFTFSYAQYEKEINDLEIAINTASNNLELEPVALFFPESWG